MELPGRVEDPMSDRPVILRPDLDSTLRKLSLEGADQHHLCRVLRRRGRLPAFIASCAVKGAYAR